MVWPRVEGSQQLLVSNLDIMRRDYHNSVIVCVCVCVCVFKMCVCVCVCKMCVCVCVCVICAGGLCMHTWVCSFVPPPGVTARLFYIYFACANAHSVCIYACMYVNQHVCMYARMSLPSIIGVKCACAVVQSRLDL